MHQLIRRFLAGTTAAAMAATALVCLSPYSAVQANAVAVGALSAGTVTAAPGETADIAVVIEENPGITAISFSVSYDAEALTLLSAEDTGLLSGAAATFGNNPAQIPYTLCWDDVAAEDHTETGTLAVLHFQVAEDAPLGSPPVILTMNTGSTFNVDLKNVPFFTEYGYVNIEAPAATSAPPETTVPSVQTTAATAMQTTAQTAATTVQTTAQTAATTAQTTAQTAATTVQTTAQPAATTVQTTVQTTAQTAATTVQTTAQTTAQTAATTVQTTAQTAATTMQTTVQTGASTAQTTAASATTGAVQSSAASETAASTVPAVTTAASTAATHPASTSRTTQPVPTTPASTAASTAATTTASTPADEGLLAVGNAQAVPDGTVEVPILLNRNPGIAALSFDISYDVSQLRLVSVRDGGLLPDASPTPGGDLSAVPYRLCWDSLTKENYTQTGVLATLVFRVSSTAGPGTCQILLTLNQSSTFNVALRNVPFAVSSGTVEILPAAQTTAVSLQTETAATETTFTETTAPVSTAPEETTPETVPTETTPTGCIRAETCAAEAGQDIEVPLYISDIPALNNLLLRIDFDPTLLTLQSAENGDILPDGCLSVMSQQGQLMLWWNNSAAADDAVTDGILARLVFRVSPEAPDQTEAVLTVTAEAAYRGSMEKLTLRTENGSILIRVPAAPSYRLGDVNADGVVNATDAAQILIAAARIGAGNDSGLTGTQQLAANVNGDDAINASDAAVVLIYAAAVGAGSYTGSLEEYLKTKAVPPAQKAAPAPKRRQILPEY